MLRQDVFPGPSEGDQPQFGTFSTLNLIFTSSYSLFWRSQVTKL
jgi:hypothetical protein